MGTAAGIGGPPLVLRYVDESPARLRATVAAVFLVGNAVAVVGYVAVGRVSVEDVLLAGAMLPAMLLGLMASRPLVRRIAVPTARKVVLGLLAAAGVAVLAQGFFGA